MFELVAIVLFIWLLSKVLRLALHLTWGVAKILASLLIAIAFPILFICVFFAGGLILLLPLAILGVAFTILKNCV